MSGKVAARARSHEDRAGDPLDGLVNLFDLGIVLAVAFLLAALSSINLTPEALKQKRPAQQQTVPKDSVLARPGQKVEQIQVQPGSKVVGQGKKLGEVYQLSDGRTVIVRPKGATGPTSR
jgi:hypothetical protein